MSIKRISLSAITLVILSGCQLAPEQQNLALPVPDAYASDAEQLLRNNYIGSSFLMTKNYKS
ncbi:hypothetical protein ACOBV9_20045 (plasmid) [Pseudoalteromonas espejiana]